MRKTIIIGLAWVLALGLTATNANATTLSIGDAYYVGLAGDATPSSEAWEAIYIKTLIGLSAGQTDTQVEKVTYNREDSSLLGLPTVLLAGSVKDDTGEYAGIDVAGYSYILGKYAGHKPGAGVFVWYVPGLTTVDLPQRSPGGNELGHYTLFAAGERDQSAPVPDGGGTLMMLGGSLVGLGALRRRFRA